METAKKNNTTKKTQSNNILKMFFDAFYEMPKHILGQCSNAPKKAKNNMSVEKIAS